MVLVADWVADHKLALDKFIERELWVAANPRIRYGSWDCTDRCDPERSGCTDCSGFDVDGLRHAGVPGFPCTGSFDLSRQIHRAGMGISIDMARRTRGALVFIGRNEGQGMLDGSADGIWPGHVATSLGDGRTVEARNHAVDVLVSTFDYRYWDYAGLPFWLPANPFVPPPPKPVSMEETDVILLYNKNKAANEQPCVFLDPGHLADPSDPEKRRMVAHYGGSIAWEGGNGDSTEHPTGTNHVTWIGIPGADTERIVSVVMVPGSMAADRSACDIVAISSAAAQRRGRAHI